MNRHTIVAAAAVAALLLALPSAVAAGRKKDRVKYVERYRDPVLKEMKEEMDSLAAVRDSITTCIKDQWKDRKKKEKEERRVIRFDFDGLVKPKSPDVFEAPFHFPPVPQYYTGTCWSFCTTSFIESEVKRLTGKEVKLSEIYTVYWEYVEKVRGYVRKRGNQHLAQGSESDAVLIIWDLYGIVPAYAYTGLKDDGARHNHSELAGEIKDYLEFVGEHGYWNEQAIIAHVRGILDRYLGRPPETFEFEGGTMTPKRFLAEVLRIDTGDYVQLMSTLQTPFYTREKFDVSDNWRPTDTYYNVPLVVFYERLRTAAKKGYTAAIGGDVSEPGYYGFEDAAIVPTFDIPQEYIDQDSREFRYFNNTTGDDHGLHLLAFKRVGGRDWFLIKDSARSSRHGAFRGYYFYRDDYIKLKMLTYMVHRDVIEDLLPRFGE